MSNRAASWQALGSSVVLRLARPGRLAEARAAVEAELAAIDYACSRFRADSELSQLNESGGRARKVSPLLFDALEVALRAAEATDGDVDPTVGVALQRAGYDRDFSLLKGASSRPTLQWDPGFCGGMPQLGAPAPDMRVRARTCSGWRAMKLDRSSRLVRLPQGVKLDLGATAKAWAADRGAAAASQAIGGTGVLLALGGDIATVGAAPSAGWRIHVTDDHRSEASAPGQTISIGGGGLATSSTTTRRWRRGTTEMHHIIDPATGAPCQSCWRTVSVAAANCTDANVASTAAILRSQRAPQWLACLGLPARLVALDGTVLRVAGWPPEVAEEELLAA